MIRTDIHSMTQDQLLSRAAALFPAEIALVYQEKHVTFTEFNRAVDTVAGHLAELGVRKGSKVGILLIPSLQYIYALYAAAKLGAAYLMLHSKMPFMDIESYLRVTGAEVFIVDHRLCDVEFRTKVTGMLGRLPAVRHLVIANGPADRGALSLDAWLAQGTGRPVTDQADLWDEVMYCFTSGTTGGRPRVIGRTQADLVCTVNHIMRLGLNEKDVMLSMIPLTAAIGIALMSYQSMVTGATLVIPDSNPKVDRYERFMQLIERERVTFLHGSPTLFLQMIASPALKHYDLSSLRLAIVTGAPMAPSELQTVAERLGCRIGQGYGMSECGVITMVTADDDEETFLHTWGKPLRERQIKVVSQDETPPRDLPTGEVGEIVVRPPGITRYFTFDVETGKIGDLMPQLVNGEGWLHTGDLGFIDARGNLQLVGRSKYIILRGGNVIYPEQIRGAIITSGKIQDVAVIGLPDPVYGEKIRACVILKDNVTCSASEIKAYCRERLEVFSVPDEVRFCDSFPLTATGKVKLEELRKREESIPVVAEAES